MIYLTGITASIATANAVPPAVPSWLDDVLAQATPLLPGSGAFSLELGVRFTVPSPKTCTGIRAYWSFGAGGPWTVTLNLWDSVGALVATESVVVPVENSYLQTTGAFGTHALTAGPNYTVSLGSFGVSNGRGSINPFTLPKAYTDYTVNQPFQYAFTGTFPNDSNATVCALVEPLF